MPYGPSGAAVEALSRVMAADLADSPVTINFYRPSATRVTPEHAEVGAAFEWQRLREQVLQPLSNKETARYQRYDWPTDSVAGWRTVPAHGVVLIEGCFLTREELRNFYDFRIWVHAPKEMRLSRGVERDGERARDRWVNEWMPEEERYAGDQERGGSRTWSSTELCAKASIPIARTPSCLGRLAVHVTPRDSDAGRLVYEASRSARQSVRIPGSAVGPPT